MKQWILIRQADRTKDVTMLSQGMNVLMDFFTIWPITVLLLMSRYILLSYMTLNLV